MVKKVVFSSASKNELKESFEYYESKQTYLGDRFLSFIEDSIKTISQNPEAFPSKIRSFRECVVPVFPFLILSEYIPEKNIVYILCVFHTSRNPDKKSI